MMEDVRDIAIDSPDAYINRELSWLHFAMRVLELAQDPSAPLLERVKFAGIMGMIYDEFAMKRIGGLRRRIEKGNNRLSPDGRTPRDELQLCRRELQRQTSILCEVVERQLRPALAEAGIPLLDYDHLDATQQAGMRQFFHESVEPILTPLAVDAGHPFPFISNLGLSLAVQLHREGMKRSRFVRIKVPPNRPRWVSLSGGGYVPLEQVIANNLDMLFPSSSHWECHFFRLTRGAKDDPWDRLSVEDQDMELAPGSLIGMVSTELTARKFAGVVRLEVSEDMPEPLRCWIAADVGADPVDVVAMNSPLALTDLVNFQPGGYHELRDPPHKPVTHPRLRHLDPADNTGDIFRRIRSGDILIHHPYQSYDTSIRRYVHVSTGNYHTGTARLYEDLSILSCNPDIGAGAAAVFNELTDAISAPGYGPLLVAPHNLRARFTDLIRREAEHCRAGRPAGILAKMNQLQDPQIIRELYLASQAGVPITLNLR